MKRTALHILSLLLLLLIATSCMRNEEDWTQPSIIVHVNSDVDVTGGKVIEVSNASLFIGGAEVASWTDDRTEAGELSVLMEFNGMTIRSGNVIDSSGILFLRVIDKSRNVRGVQIRLWADSDAPVISIFPHCVRASHWNGESSSENIPRR